MPWDCKVTPTSCTCQERNTIGCIPSNDGLDAGLGPGFPQLRIYDGLTGKKGLGGWLTSAIPESILSHCRYRLATSCGECLARLDKRMAVARSCKPRPVSRPG